MTAPITFITGTSRGIGQHLANHFLERGHAVIGTSRSPSSIAHANYVHFTADATDEKSMRQVFADVQRKFGRLDNLINNAGVSFLNHSLTMPLGDVSRIMNVNYLATFLACQEGARLMMPGKFGRIVNFSSVSVPLRTEGVAAYASAKAAVEELTRILAKEYGEFGITVNCVGPSAIQTQLTKNLPPEKFREMIDRQSIKTEARPDDVANVVDFFLRAESRLITGQVIYMGGMG